MPDPLPRRPRGRGAGPPAALLSQNPFSPPADSPPQDVLPPIDVPAPPPGAAAGRAAPVPRPARRRVQPPVGAGEPPGSFPSIPGQGMTNVGPDRNDPFPNRSFADVITSVEEAPTGRFMVSVGANSFQGLMGSITIYGEELRPVQPPADAGATSSTARRSAAAARSSGSTSRRAP